MLSNLDVDIVAYTISQEPSFVVSVNVPTAHRLDIMDYVIAIGCPTARMKIAARAQFVPDSTLRCVRTHNPSWFFEVSETKLFALLVNATMSLLPFFLTSVVGGPVLDFVPFDIWYIEGKWHCWNHFVDPTTNGIEFLIKTHFRFLWVPTKPVIGTSVNFLVVLHFGK
jgi:hypothetical protein